MFEKVVNDLKARLPDDLVDALLVSYKELKQNYLLGRHEPSELNGGKFCEACFRILQYETANQNYTALGTPIPNLIGKLRGLESIPTSVATRSYRIHIPRVLVSMFNIRNQRGVGHLGGDVNPNYSDSTLLVASADWILAELFRIHYQCSLDEAQEIVDTLVQRPLALVFELQERKRVLLPSLSHRDQTLLLLASEYPRKVNIDLLLSWIEPANKSRYVNQILRSLHAQRFLEFDDDGGWCIILPPGLGYVESNYGMWLDKLN